MPRLHDLQRLCDAALVAGLPPSLKTAIAAAALKAGTTPRLILRRIRQQTGGRQSLTALGVEAHLAQLEREAN